MSTNPIRIDDREKVPPPAVTAGWLQDHGVEAKVDRLTQGDFSFLDGNGGMVLVTRKAKDLFDSVYSKHLNEELEGCIKTVAQYGKGSVWFMLDGIYVPTRFAGKDSQIGVYTTTGRNTEWLHLETERAGQPTMIAGIAASLWASGIGFLPTTHVPSTLKLLYERGQKVDDKGRWPSSISRGVQRPQLKWHSDTSKVARLMALWPRLPERPASLLMAEFGSIREIVRLAKVDEKKLLSIPGVGKTGLTNFKEVLD